MNAPTLLTVLVTTAVLVWPGRRPVVGGRGIAGLVAAPPLERGPSRAERLRQLAGEDPVELARALWLRHRGRRRAEDFNESLLALLDALEPALRAGLPPARALKLAAGGLVTRPSGTDAGTVDEIVQDAIRAAEAGGSVGRVWQWWAGDAGSGAGSGQRTATLRFVAAAWLLSERTGAPLAEAVARAAARTRAELSRRRRVNAAVAGPRATVNVLSALPLVGPLFGLASGLGPSEVYLSSPLVMVGVAFGLGLIGLGRWWCHRLVRGVLEPS